MSSSRREPVDRGVWIRLAAAFAALGAGSAAIVVVILLARDVLS